MFRKTSNDSQLGIFSSPDALLRGRSGTIYHDKNNWHNLFRQQVTARIDEGIFKPLYRGLVKHKMWANMRCLWVNFVRIVNHLAAQGAKTAFSALKGLLSAFKMRDNDIFRCTTILRSENKFFRSDKLYFL